MFSIRKPESHPYTPQFSSPLSRFSPQASSPLSPRDANLPSPLFTKYTTTKDRVMSSPTPPSRNTSFQQQNQQTPIFQFTPQTPPPTRKNSAFSKRASKPNPLFGSREEGRETRRKLFLKRVREGAEKKRWEGRGGDEEILRVIWVGEQAREKEEMRRKRMEMGLDRDEVIEELSLDEVMADEVAIQEELELEALLSMQEQAERTQNQEADMNQQHTNDNFGYGVQKPWAKPVIYDQPPTPTSTNYGSDDDEYDSIFIDVIEEEVRMSQSQQGQSLSSIGGMVMPSQVQNDHDMMDMS